MDLEPLATYLAPHHGDIYDYDSWTDDLLEAVRLYLIKVVPEQLYIGFLDYAGREVPSGHRAKQVEYVLSKYFPWELAGTFHDVAVLTMPTLDQLIDEIERVPSMGDSGDVALWLSDHATDSQVVQMIKEDGSHPELLSAKEGRGHRNPDAYDLAEVLTLPKIRALWSNVSPESRTPISAQGKDTRAVSAFDATSVRAWARVRGYDIGDRGRLPVDIVAAYADQ